jgi:glutamate dehydrogenase
MLPGGFDVVELSTLLNRPLDLVAGVHMALGATLGLDELGVAIGALASQGHWQSVARSSLREDLHRLHRALTQKAIERRGKGVAARIASDWLQTHQRGVDHFLGIAGDIRSAATVDFPTLSVALQSLRRLAGT